MPNTLICLRHDDNDVSQTVTELCHQYVLLLRQLRQLSDVRTSIVSQILQTVFEKYRYPDDFNHDKDVSFVVSI